MEWLTISELGVGAVLLLVVGLIGFLWLRRQFIGNQGPTMLCAIRTPTAKIWRLGLLRFGPSALEWFSFAGPSLRPARSWHRRGVEIGIPQPAEELIPGLTDPVRVDLRSAGERVELAMARGSHTAVRSWVESSPPGSHIDIT